MIRTPVSSLKVAWRKDRVLDSAIERDKRLDLCLRVVREVLLEPRRCIPLRYLEKRRDRLRLPFRLPTFLSRYPLFFDSYPDRIRPNQPPVPFLRPSPRLNLFLHRESQIRSDNEALTLAKLCKLLMISKHKVISAEKLLNVKRDFGFGDDFLVRLVPKHPHLLRLTGNPGEGKSFLELVSWNEDFAKSAIEKRAEEESELTGIKMRPNFSVKLPKGFYLRKEMREWVRDWLELPYVSPYADASGLSQASPEMEKRTVGVLHEMLSMSVLRRMAVPVMGKFCEEFRFSNAFGNAFTRHSGIFYVSLKGGIKTAVLREAYDGEGVLVDRDPLMEIRDQFTELMDEGHKEWKERVRLKREAVQRELEMVAKRNAETCEHDVDDDENEVEKL
ncbi:protein ROOT PRIMORDIUM DEFECTIVE 1 [Iris pallida]|uniref:Protein ROOT PRIMORDIUM DEFECTIVE 1 n=1 Tax=Iris pallida TaxID=29817 RepID=A0AAX6DV85_IRIPA|nr:protein ROOT PRIMORDIUM DEFECTIVE 1 [Iris pallida]